MLRSERCTIDCTSRCKKEFIEKSSAGALLFNTENRTLNTVNKLAKASLLTNPHLFKPVPCNFFAGLFFFLCECNGAGFLFLFDCFQNEHMLFLFHLVAVDRCDGKTDENNRQYRVGEAHTEKRGRGVFGGIGIEAEKV